MKLLLIFALVAMVLARPEEDHYDEKYDNFDVDELIDNPRLLKSHALCFEGEGKCTPDGNNFKKWMPEAVQSKCGKCTPKQKVLIAKVMKALMEKLPEHWEKLYNTYDPEKERTAEVEAFIAEYAH